MAGDRARLLVVDDDQDFAEALERGLRAEGFDVTIAADGVDGMAHAERRRFDAIVLDLMMPRLNGFKICQLLRARGDVTPVLVLTAKLGEWDEAEALDTGADDYLKKPCSFVVLVAHLHAILRRQQSPSDVVLAAGDLELNTTLHRCRRGDADIELTPREYALLLYLLRRAGEPISKREILDNVWDWALDDNSNLVEVYIGYLRRKLDTPYGRHGIQTVRGVGYRLDPSGG
jgi:DNA-binding response OmpR family regulator